ncbi:MAG: hypothetical protein DRP42_00225 [Tenericutes bacterium]|nr:MAG: hypothetical protein DRP42_00225 [Mycoplasmatota bacterium]
MKAKNKKIIAHAVGYTTAIGVTLAATIPFMFSASQSFMGGIHEVSFLSNVPNYRDKGFNEVSHDGMYNYARLTNQNVGVMGGTYSETGESYTSALNTLFDNGAKYVTAAGFNLAGFN